LRKNREKMTEQNIQSLQFYCVNLESAAPTQNVGKNRIVFELVLPFTFSSV